jgi:tetratricopeptide (TPR) repeat protein
MAHPTPAELLASFRAARAVGEQHRADPHQLTLLRDMVAICPAFIPNLLETARLLRLTDQPDKDVEEVLDEVQQLLEHAVQASNRSPDTLIELAYFLDTHRKSPDAARKLLEEGAAKALSALEDAWTGLIRLLEMEQQLPQALELSARAEKLFPESERIMGAVYDARQSAVTAGLLPPETLDP